MIDATVEDPKEVEKQLAAEAEKELNKSEEEAQAASGKNELEEELFVEEIEGVGKFEAKTQEELRSKIFSAFKEASVKAKAAPATVTEVKKVERKKLSQDEEFALGEEFKTKPIVAFRKFMEQEYGVTPENLTEALSEAQESKKLRIAQAATSEFIEKTPDFPMSPRNQQIMGKWLLANGKNVTVESLTEAYKDLSENGLLAKVEKAEVVESSSVRRTAASGLFGKRGAGTRSNEVKKVPNEKEIDKKASELNPDQLLEYLSAVAATAQ